MQLQGQPSWFFLCLGWKSAGSDTLVQPVDEVVKVSVGFPVTQPSKFPHISNSALSIICVLTLYWRLYICYLHKIFSPDHSNPIPFSQLVQVELAILSPEIRTDVWKELQRLNS